MPDLVPVRRALISVSDKTGLVEFARALARRGVEIISTGQTAAALAAAAVPVVRVEDITGFPEIMGGRVKTLHPLIHGAILAVRDDAEHQRAVATHGIKPIDLVCIGLYPFEQTAARPGVTPAEAIEQIDVGGPAMIRAAAKNHAYVAILTSPDQIARLLADIEENAGATSLSLRAALAAEAFARTAAYDAAIAAHLHAPGDDFPARLTLSLVKSSDLRYGENPHQRAAAYRHPAFSGPSALGARLLSGKELSYNNLADASAALGVVTDLARHSPGRFAAAVIKHANPCGAATAPSAAAAVELALRGDPLAAYGGILALSGTIDGTAAEIIARPGQFLEVIIAPGFDEKALEVLQGRWPGVRLLATGPLDRAARWLSWRSLPGGALVQSPDDAEEDPDAWGHRAGPAPTAEQRQAALVVWLIAKHLSSNAVAIGGRESGAGGAVRLFGAGAGQMDRVAACRIAIEKAGTLALGASAASDGFFPFPDGPKVLIDAGVRLIVQPGGSKRDEETFRLCNEHDVTCLTTGVRHFRH